MEIAVKLNKVISHTNQIKDFIDCDSLRQEWMISAARLRSYRVIIPASYYSKEMFFRHIEALGSIAMVQQGDRNKFEIDQSNLGIIENLYKYVIYDSDCAWNLDKGILLIGSYGTGKSILLKAYVNILQRFADSDLGQSMKTKVFKFDSAQNIFNEILEYSGGKLPLRLINSGLCIDELGRETKKAINYGTETTPVIDLLLERYSKGLPTFGTSNFSLQGLTDEYGQVIGDRLRSMFNFVEMIGKSRRK